MFISSFLVLFGTLALVLTRKVDSDGDLNGQITIVSFSIFAIYFVFMILIKSFTFESICVGIIMFFVFNTAYQSTLLNIDRSRSFYVLGWVKNDKVKTVGDQFDFSSVNSEERKNENAMIIRLNEQLDRGFIKLDQNSISLTLLGETAFMVAEIASRVFRLENWESNKN